MAANVIRFLRRAFSSAPVASSLLVIALIACLIFGARSAVFWLNRPPLAEREQPVAEWMTPRFVARSWGVPLNLVLESVEIDRAFMRGPVSLAQIAEVRGVSVEQIIKELEADIDVFRSDRRDGGTK